MRFSTARAPTLITCTRVRTNSCGRNSSAAFSMDGNISGVESIENGAVIIVASATILLKLGKGT